MGYKGEEGVGGGGVESGEGAASHWRTRCSRLCSLPLVSVRKKNKIVPRGDDPKSVPSAHAVIQVWHVKVELLGG